MPGLVWYHQLLAIVNVRLGRLEEARRNVSLLRQSFPDFDRVAYLEHRKWLWNEREVEDMIEGLREAGMDIPLEPKRK
jgi:hypothetical protein